MKPGYTTTEFWTTVATNVLAVVTLIFHTHINVDVPRIATAAAGLSNFGYAFARSHVKGKFLEAEANKLFAAPVKAVTESSTVNVGNPVPVVVSSTLNPEAFGF